MTMRTPAENQALIQRLEWLAFFLDSRYRIPGTNIRLGWDGLIGLLPGVGDILTFLLSSTLVVYAGILGVSRWTLLRMLGNILIDLGVGAVPVAGDVFDVFWRANCRNVRLLVRHLKQTSASA